MKFKNLVINVSLFIAVLLSIQSYAEDIELYVNHNVDLDERPRVLLIFDTSGSMAFSSKTGKDCGQYSNGDWVICNDSRLGVARKAMAELITGNPDIDFGLMRYNSTNGGYILNGIGSSHTAIKASINDLPANGGTPLAETLWEAYLYITGKSLHYALNVSESSRDTNVENKVYAGREQVRKCNPWWNCWYEWQYNYNYTYVSPFADSAEEAKRCDNSVNIIYMTDGDPSQGSDNDSDNVISDAHKGYFGSALGSGDYLYSNYLHQLAKVIHGTDTTKVDLYPLTKDIHETGRLFTIGFGSGMSQQGQQLLEEAGRLGGGGNFPASTPEQLVKALNQAVSFIRSVNDTFTSPAVASNNVDQTRSRDAIYYAMFYPKPGARWIGNLKKLKVSGTQIVDSKNNQALNKDGLIKKEAHTFWLDEDAAADGNSVQNGGVNAVLTKNASARKVLTDANTGGLINFDFKSIKAAYSNETEAAKYFAVSKNDLEDTINWARGIDVDNANAGSELRADIFGDPLHSKPVAIDYGNGNVRILIGTNAGFLHMFKDSGDTVNESWAFMPSSLYKIIDPLRKNTQGIKKYGVDGPITIYFDDANRDGVVNGSDRVWAFFGMRRGGTNYYGIDITAPDAPKLMWGGPIQGGSGRFTELAQTWSAPTISFIKAYGKEPVLIFGAGYDTNKDNVALGDDNKGRGIYIVKASDGSLIWELTPAKGFKGKNSIAANVTTLDSDYDGYIDRIYAADTRGSIWRIDMPTESIADWTHFELAKFSGATNALDRRFFYKPVVARTMFSKVTNSIVSGKSVVTRQDTPFDAILLGSGNRSNPLGTISHEQLYMIRDINTVTKSFKGNDIPTVITEADLMNVNSDPFGNSLNDIDKFTKKEIELSNYNGWYYDLPARGEKSLAAATVVGGVAYFTSYTPASATETVNQCSLSGGRGSMYAFHLHYGTKVYDQLSFTTSNDVPDTPQLYFGEGPSCVDKNNNGKCDAEPKNKDPDSPEDTEVDVKKQSQFLLIGPGVKQPTCPENCDQNPNNPFIPKEILGPGIAFDKDGKIKLVSDAVPIGFGFKTQQTFIYKREVNDNRK